MPGHGLVQQTTVVGREQENKINTEYQEKDQVTDQEKITSLENSEPMHGERLSYQLKLDKVALLVATLQLHH